MILSFGDVCKVGQVVNNLGGGMGKIRVINKRLGIMFIQQTCEKKNISLFFFSM